MNAILTKLDWKAITGALFALGIVSTQDPLMAAVSITAMVLVYLINLIVRTFNIKPNRTWLTVLLYLISLGLAVAFEPQALPAFPAWAGDAANFADAISVWLVAAAPVAGLITGAATLIYNALYPLVIKPLENKLAR